MYETTHARVCRGVLPMFLGLFAGACSVAADEEPKGMTGSAIVGGAEDAGHPNVGAIEWDVTSDDGKKGVSNCTGTIISPTAIISAAHCVLPPAGMHFSNYRFTLDRVATPASRWIPISRVVAHPGYVLGAFGSGNDVSVMTLSAPVVNVAPAALLGAIKENAVGTAVTAVGYGLSDGVARTGLGTKRVVTVRLTGIDAREFKFGEPGHATCGGDSGGPVFMNVDGREVIAGLTSYGMANCSQAGYATRVDRVLDFVNAALGGGGALPPPPGLGGDTDDNGDTNEKPDGKKPGGTTPGPYPTPGGTDPGGTGTNPSDDEVIDCLVGCYYSFEDRSERSACFDECLAAISP